MRQIQALEVITLGRQSGSSRDSLLLLLHTRLLLARGFPDWFLILFRVEGTVKASPWNNLETQMRVHALS